jgi:hypothetical protein
MPAADPPPTPSPSNKGEGPRSMSPRAFGWTVRDDSVLPNASPAPSRRVTDGLRVGRPARHGAGSSSVPAPPKECVREVLLPHRDRPQGKQPTFSRPIFPNAGLFTTAADCSTETHPYSTNPTTFVHKQPSYASRSRTRIKSGPGRVGTCENGDRSSPQSARCSSGPDRPMSIKGSARPTPTRSIGDVSQKPLRPARQRPRSPGDEPARLRTGW